MKRFYLFLALFMLFAPKIFALSLKGDYFAGGSSAGLDVGMELSLVFGTEHFKHSAGAIYNDHKTSQMYRIQKGSSYDYVTRSVDALCVGGFYGFNYERNFFTNGFFAFGFDAGAEIGLVYDFISKINGFLAIIPALQISLGNFDIDLGYRATLYLMNTTFSNSVQVGIKYNFGKHNYSDSVKKTKNQNSNSEIYILPGSTFKSVEE